MLKKFRIVFAVAIAIVGMMGTMAPSGVSAQSVQNPISVPAGATIDDLLSVGASFALNDGNECGAGTPRVVMGVDGDWIWGYFGSTPATINDCSLAGANLIASGMWESPRTGANNYTSFSAVLAEYSGSPITALLIIDENEIIEDLVPFAEWVAPPAPAPGYMTVVVLDADDNPIEGATVSFDTIDESGTVYPNDGSFTTSLQYEPGTYTFTVMAPGYGNTPGSVTISDGNAGTTVYPTALPVTFPGYMTVIVLDADDNPIEGATVSFDTIDESGTVYPNDGSFTTSLQYEPGTYTFTVMAPGYENTPGSVTIVEGNASTTVYPTALPVTVPGYMTVIVLDADDNPIEGATVSFDTIDESGTVYPNDGSFTTSQQYEPGTYTFTVVAPGYESVTGSVTIVEGNASTTLNLSLPVDDDGVTMNIWKFVCSGFSEAQEDGCVENDALNGTDVDFTVSYTVGEDVTTVDTSLEIEGSEGSAVLTLPLADSFTVCETVPEGVSEVVFNVAGIDDVDVDDDGCVTFSGEGISDGDELNIAFWNIVPTDGSETPEQPVVPVKPGKDDAKPASVTSLPETGSGAASTVATAPIMLIAAAAAAAGVGAILRKDR